MEYFISFDGTVVSSVNYHYGDEIKVPLDTPTRQPDETYTNEFDHWDIEKNIVTGNKTYITVYNQIYINYTIIFENYDGTVISTKTNYHYGDAVTVPVNPTRPSDGTYNIPLYVGMQR